MHPLHIKGACFIYYYTIIHFKSRGNFGHLAENYIRSQ